MAPFLNYIIFKIVSINGTLVSTPSLVLLLLPSFSINRSLANTIISNHFYIYILFMRLVI